MSLRCVCDIGYALVGGNCVDIDECTRYPAPCGTGVSCTNLDGAYQCSTCPVGQSDYFGFCQRLDVCDYDMLYPVCYFEAATCAVTPIGTLCGCPPGFVDDGFLGCVDYDECAVNACDPNGTVDGEVCTNTYGSFNCVCPPGTVSSWQGCVPP